MPPRSQCRGAVSNCWAPGEPDWDCPNNSLCCFDGCANTCLGSPTSQSQPQTQPRPQSRPQTQPRPQPRPQARPQPRPQPQQAAQQSDGGGVYGVPADYDEGSGDDLEVTEGSGDTVSSPQTGNGLLFPPPSLANSQPPSPPSPPSPPPPRPNTGNGKTGPRPVRPANNNQVKIEEGLCFETILQGGEVKPYLRCPSAMECVQRVNCDFEGFITTDTLNLSPDLEMLRVPLIVSPLQIESSVLISHV